MRASPPIRCHPLPLPARSLSSKLSAPAPSFARIRFGTIPTTLLCCTHPCNLVFMFGYPRFFSLSDGCPPNTRPLGTSQVRVDARPDRVLLGNGGARLQPGVRVRFASLGGCTTHTLAVGRTMRLPYGTLLAQKIGGPSCSAPQKERRSIVGTRSLSIGR